MSENTPRSLRAPIGPATDRAPRLRRIAELIDVQAGRSENPEKARALARDMRARAAQLECGEVDPIEAAELLQELLD